MEDFQLRRIRMVMEPEPGNPNEVEGVLNPAAARGPDGELYLFPQLVAKGNYSRIGIARVRIHRRGCILILPSTYSTSAEASCLNPGSQVQDVPVWLLDASRTGNGPVNPCRNEDEAAESLMPLELRQRLWLTIPAG